MCNILKLLMTLNVFATWATLQDTKDDQMNKCTYNVAVTQAK